MEPLLKIELRIRGGGGDGVGGGRDHRSLQPILVYIACLVFLDEKFNYKKIVAFAIVLASIVSAQFLSGGF